MPVKIKHVSDDKYVASYGEQEIIIHRSTHQGHTESWHIGENTNRFFTGLNMAIGQSVLELFERSEKLNRGMKYFEFHNPYFGLVKAHSEKEAKETYQSTISELEPTDTCEEVSADEALELFQSACAKRIADDPNFDVYEEFYGCPTTYPLLMDSSLA